MQGYDHLAVIWVRRKETSAGDQSQEREANRPDDPTVGAVSSG